MTEFTGDGLRVNPRDLNSITPKGDDDDRMFHHNGASPISTVGGGSDSERGYYIWDADKGAWYPLFRNADKIDGKDAGDFLQRDGSIPMLADLDMDNYGIVNLGEASGGTGGIHLNDNHVVLHSHEVGANIRLNDANGLLIAEAIEGGNFDVPNGELSEAGARVATRTWTNTNADVPNADYADEANKLDGYDEGAFLHVSGDQMEGVLDMGGFNLNDGGTTKYDSTTGNFVQSALEGPAGSLSSYPLANSDIANPSVTVTAGNQLSGGGNVALGGTITLDLDEGNLDAGTLDSLDSSQFLRSDTSDTLNSTLSVSGETKVQFGGSNYSVRYDSGRDVLVLGSAENGEMMELDNAGNLSIEGSLTEGATIGA